MKRLFENGQRKFWVASAYFKSVCEKEVVAMEALPATGMFADRPDEAYTYSRYSTVFAGDVLDADSMLDHNLIRNNYNDWWVFPTKRAADRYVRRGR